MPYPRMLWKASKPTRPPDSRAGTGLRSPSPRPAVAFPRSDVHLPLEKAAQYVRLETPLRPISSKDANGFDLPIVLGLLLASGQVAFDRPGNYAIVGELALTGETRPIK
jgi:Subunit ChlI of Mg-chelatase